MSEVSGCDNPECHDPKCGTRSPTQIVAKIYEEGSDMFKSFLDLHSADLLANRLRMYAVLKRLGPVLEKDAVDSFEAVLTKSYAALRVTQRDPYKVLSATAQDIGINLAKEMDAAAKRILLQDTHIDHFAYMRVMFAIIEATKAVGDLALSDEQQAQVDESAAKT